MIVLALDLSLTASGWAVGAGGILTSHGLIPGKCDGVQRLIYNRNRVCEKIESVIPSLVVFEDFSFGSNMSYSKEIAGMSYMIRAELVQEKIPYLCVSPMSLKKFVVGTAGSAKQKVTKDLVIKEIFKRFSIDVNDNNIADAVGLAFIGMALMNEWQPQIEPQRQVLDGLRKNNPWLPVQSGQSKEASSDW